MKKFLSLILIVLLCINPVFAADSVKFHANMQTEFLENAENYDNIRFVNNSDVKINDEITIPAEAVIEARVHQFQTEKRWHKSGYIICSLINYTLNDDIIVDLSDEEIYFIARKYEALDKKEASIIGTELVLTQAASIVASCFIIFAPIDIAYFFTKGAIKRKKNPNWFKSGVMEAYDNSIFWFQLKGKPIDLAEGDNIKLKSLSKQKADKMSAKIEKNKAKKLAKYKKKNNEVSTQQSL